MASTAGIVGNAVGLVTVAAKAWFDLVWNDAIDKKAVEALKQKRGGELTSADEFKLIGEKAARRDTSTVATFVGLAISFAILLIGEIYG